MNIEVGSASLNSRRTLRGMVQEFGMFLSSMVMPNIGSFIAWGFITAIFIPTGWFPNERLGQLVGPMLRYLLPLQVAATGGKLVGGKRGSVVAGLATIGLAIGSEKPMLLGAMIMGPVGGYLIKTFDTFTKGKIKREYEELVNDFSIGVIGGLLSIFSFLAIGPSIDYFVKILMSGVELVVSVGLLPLTSIFIEPGKILFLNNDINLTVLGPIGSQQVKEFGQSVYFLMEANPGPGFGVLMAYWLFSSGSQRQSAPGAIIIHLIGGIHEIYFPYILVKPIMIFAVVFGGASGLMAFNLLGAGLVAAPRPGSIIQVIAMSPAGGVAGVLIGVAVSALVSFILASIFIKSFPDEIELAWKSK